MWWFWQSGVCTAGRFIVSTKKCGVSLLFWLANLFRFVPHNTTHGSSAKRDMPVCYLA